MTDLDNKVNLMIVRKYGKDMDIREGVDAKYYESELYLYMFDLIRGVFAYTYCAINNKESDVEVTLDCS